MQSSYESTGSVLEGVGDVPSQLGAFTDQYTFEYRFITKAAAKQEIDAIVAEGFDFFFNFLRGTLDDPVAGALESQYFESLGLPSCGVRSWERLTSKNDFYQKARSLRAPPVPGTANFPLFVKPANGCASQMIDERSVCHNEEELHGALQRINGKLHEVRPRRAEALGIKDKEAYANRYDPVGRDSDDVVIQEYIDGQDYTCTVIKMGDGCLALAPFRYEMPSAEDKFLTFDLRFHEKTRMEMLSKKDDPAAFERIQRVAIEA